MTSADPEQSQEVAPPSPTPPAAATPGSPAPGSAGQHGERRTRIELYRPPKAGGQGLSSARTSPGPHDDAGSTGHNTAPPSPYRGGQGSSLLDRIGDDDYGAPSSSGRGRQGGYGDAGDKRTPREGQQRHTPREHGTPREHAPSPSVTASGTVRPPIIGGMPKQSPRGSSNDLASKAGGGHQGSSDSLSSGVVAGGISTSASASVLDSIANAPLNPNFVTPVFPQPPLTNVESSSQWALMLEAGAQNLESVLGPLAEGIVCEAEGTAQYEAAMQRLGLPLPPLNAQECITVLSSHPVMKDKLPVTIRKRLEASSEALAALAEHQPGRRALFSPPSSAGGAPPTEAPAAPAQGGVVGGGDDKLGPEAVITGHTAFRSVLQDCLKALKLPSLLRNGSRQFITFVDAIQPHVESAVVMSEVLLADASEAAALYKEHMGAAQAADSVAAAAAAMRAATLA